MEPEAERPQAEETQEQPGAARGAQPASEQAADAPVAKPVPKRSILTRRVFILGGFWSTLGLALVGLLGPSLDFAWTRDPAGAARVVRVPKDSIPKPGDAPVRIPEGRFFLVNLEPGTTPTGRRPRAGCWPCGRHAPTWVAPYPGGPISPTGAAPAGSAAPATAPPSPKRAAFWSSARRPDRWTASKSSRRTTGVSS